MKSSSTSKTSGAGKAQPKKRPRRKRDSARAMHAAGKVPPRGPSLDPDLARRITENGSMAVSGD